MWLCLYTTFGNRYVYCLMYPNRLVKIAYIADRFSCKKCMPYMTQATKGVSLSKSKHEDLNNKMI